MGAATVHHDELSSRGVAAIVYPGGAAFTERDTAVHRFCRDDGTQHETRMWIEEGFALR